MRPRGERSLPEARVAIPFTLSLSKGERAGDANGWKPGRALSGCADPPLKTGRKSATYAWRNP